jgi:hypothetical protein
MKGWRIVKITLAVVLVLANLFMILFLDSVFRADAYIPEETIRQARELLRSDGIVIGQRVVDSKKVNLPIYEGTLPQDYHASVAAGLSGSDVIRSFDAPNGVVISMANGDRYMFSDGFDIRYTAGVSTETVSVEAENVAALSPLSAGMEDSVRRAVSKFLGRAGAAHSDQSASLTYTVVDYGRDDATGILYCVCEQAVDRRSLADFRAVFAVSDGKVVGMSGSWCFASTDGIYSAQLLDQINILYSVRNRILEERGNATDSREEILSLEIGYAVYFRSDTESFYLIPAWIVQTGSGKTYSINAVDGTLYTK